MNSTSSVLRSGAPRDVLALHERGLVALRLLSMVLAMIGAGCSDGHTLRVDVATDLLAGVEFDRSVIRLDGEQMETAALENQSWFSGARAATFEGLGVGTYEGSVALVLGATTVLERPVRIRVEGDTLTTFYLLRSCVGIDCPGAGDSPSAIACLGGTCVAPECEESAGEVCASPQCVESTDCPAVSACFARVCERGLCLVEDACDEGTRCDVASAACVPRMPMESDAGIDASFDAGVDTGVDASDAAMDVPADVPPDSTIDAAEEPPSPPLAAIVAKAFNADEGDNLGSAVAISGDGSTAAFGAYDEASSERGVGASGADNDAPGAGAVYVFWNSPEGELRRQFLKASNADANDLFGHSLALSENGRVLAVGARAEASLSTLADLDADNNGALGAGAVYIFERTGDTWVETAYLKPLNTNAGDGFGWSLALSGDGQVLVVGAPLEDSAVPGVNSAFAMTNNAATSAGAAYVFRGDGGRWSQVSYINPSNARPGALFGTSVAISGDGSRIVVGAIGESSGVPGDGSDTSAEEAGAAYLYEWRGANFEEVAYLKAEFPDAGDHFGASVAISGDGAFIVASATFEASSSIGVNRSAENNATTSAGAAYLFRESAGWEQTDYLKAPTVSVGDFFGSQVAISGDGSRVFVGSHGHQSLEGALYIYFRDGDEWSEIRTIRWPFPDAQDRYGFSVSCSYDGTRVATGAPGEDSSPDFDTSDDSIPSAGAGRVSEVGP